MSNEAQVRSALSINKGNTRFPPSPAGTFNATVNTANPIGPVPGAFLASIFGTDVDLSKLVALGGLYTIQNLDQTNFVSVGIYDPDARRFYPFRDILPGEHWTDRLSRFYREDFSGRGTGTTTMNNTLRVMANTAPCVVNVCAFDF